MYSYTILVPKTKTITFKSKYYECPDCHKRIQKHIICEGARWHVHSWNSSGTHCSESDCEDNHGKGKCIEEKK